MRYRLVLICVLLIVPARLSGGSPWVRHEFCQIAAGGGIRSIILVLNPHSVTVGLKLEFFGDDGNPLSFTVDGKTDSTVELQVLAGGTRRIEITHPGGAQAGWGRLTATRTVGAQLLFEIFSGENLVTQAAVEAIAPVNIAQLFVDGTKGNTGIALANVSDVGTIRVALVLRNQEGQTQATVRRTLGPRGHLAKFFSEFFPDHSAARGSLEVVSTGPVVLITLQQTGLVLGTLPVITPPPVKGVFK